MRIQKNARVRANFRNWSATLFFFLLCTRARERLVLALSISRFVLVLALLSVAAAAAAAGDDRGGSRRQATVADGGERRPAAQPRL